MKTFELYLITFSIAATGGSAVELLLSMPGSEEAIQQDGGAAALALGVAHGLRAMHNPDPTAPRRPYSPAEFRAEIAGLTESKDAAPAADSSGAGSYPAGTSELGPGSYVTRRETGPDAAKRWAAASNPNGALDPAAAARAGCSMPGPQLEHGADEDSNTAFGGES